MKKFILFVLFAGIVSYSAVYLYHSGKLFSDELHELSTDQDTEDDFAFKQLVDRYPYSPFLGIARLGAVNRDTAYIAHLDRFYEAREELRILDAVVGRSPAYYDPFFFAALGYFLLLTFLGGLQRFWADSMGLGMMAILSRILFVTGLAYLYIAWVRQSMDPESVITHLMGRIHPVLNEPLGIMGVTVGLSAIVLSINLILTLVTFLGFLGKRSTRAG
jgi:hypothetical protein